MKDRPKHTGAADSQAIRVDPCTSHPTGWGCIRRALRPKGCNLTSMVASCGGGVLKRSFLFESSTKIR